MVVPVLPAAGWLKPQALAAHPVPLFITLSSMLVTTNAVAGEMGGPGGLFFGRDLGMTKKSKGRRRKKVKGQALGDVMFGSLMETMELLFVLVREVVGTDYMYVTHDDEDQTVWDQLAANWVLYGKR